MTDVHIVSRMDKLRDTVRSRIESLQGSFLANKPSAAASLAQLRRCDPSEVGSDPRIWSLTVADLPDILTDLRAGRPTRVEQALHAAMVLYAIHQQGHRTDPAHRRAVRLGTAVGRLARSRGIDGSLDGSVVQRFHQVAIAHDRDARLHHLRGIVTLMRGETPVISLDYGLLAVDLARLDDPRSDHSFVLTRWGRDLHSTPTTKPEETE